MSFAKVFGMLLLLTSCSLGGMLWGTSYHRRVSALEEARALLLALRGQLAFTLSPPEALLNAVQLEPTFARCDYLSDACQEIHAGADVETAWRRAVRSSREPFTPEDRAQLVRMGELLGKSDLETQLSQLLLLSERIEQRAGQARGQASVQARLSTTLGSLAGLALVILLC